MTLINPRFIKIVVNQQNEVVAFVIGMSHIGDGIKKAKGYLFPFGIFQIFRAARKSKQLNLLLGGVDPEYRGKGLDVMMGVRMLESAIAQGKTTLDSHLELENNTAVRAEMERMGGKVYKRFRIFGKTLTDQCYLIEREFFGYARFRNAIFPDFFDVHDNSLVIYTPE